MKILVTGGTGFIGQHLSDQLSNCGHDIVVLDLFESERGARPHEFVQGDVRDVDRVRAAMEGCDAVMHLAAAHHDFGISPRTYHNVNEGGSSVICSVMDERAIRRACFVSSVAVYGRSEAPPEETTDPNPDSAYGASKLAGENVFQAWVEKGDGRSALIVRPTATFGPRNYANMFSLIRQIDRRRYWPVGAGRNRKSLAYVENLVDALTTLWGAPRSPWEVYNLVDKPDLTSGQISGTIYRSLGRRSPPPIPLALALGLALPFDAVIAATGRNLPISSMRVRKFASSQTVYKAARLHASGFVGGVTLEEGIRRMVSWFVGHARHDEPVRRLPPAERES